MNFVRWMRRSGSPYGFNQWVSDYLQWNGLQYGVGGTGTLAGDQESIEASFPGYVQGAFKQNGIVFACMVARMLLFSEARFQFRRIVNGRPSRLFGTPALALLETPWDGGTTGQLLTRMIQDVDLSGNSYTLARGDALRRLRPDWVTIVMGSKSGSPLDREVLGYMFQPGGPGSSEKAIPLLPEQVAHFAPIKDPIADYRGMSWLTPVITEILGDKAAMTHKLKFFENGATPNLVVKLDAEAAATPAAFKEWVDMFEEEQEGLLNAYRTLYLGGGSDATVIGANMRQIDFKVTQGHGETRMAAAARIPAIIVGLSEGMEAATYSNYGQARRAFADGTMRPLWREAAGALQKLIAVPTSAQLWYDDRDISFLQEDRKDAAEIALQQATTMQQLIAAGFEPETVRDAVDAEDWTLLAHTGLVSTMLMPPGTDGTDSASANGNGKVPAEGAKSVVLAGHLVRALHAQQGRRLLEQHVSS